MKKKSHFRTISFVVTLAIILATLLSVNTIATSSIGQVVGKVLSTDIRAFINGAEIPAYNIDGKLAVVVSDLNNYGFNTQYNNDLRKTTVTRDTSASEFVSVPSKSLGLPIGTPVMSVFSSDIIVELDGRQVPAFNVDNRMAIYFTELKEYGTYGYDNASRASVLQLGETSTPSVQVEPQQVQKVEANSFFAIHYIDVGQADAALVLCDGHAMLIDGGNVDDSSLIYSYLKKLSVSHLDYIIGSHAHEDHIGGIAGALNYATVGTVYCPTLSYDTQAFSNFKKYVEKAGAVITVPTAGTTFSLGSASVQILGPTERYSDEDNNSIILKITYGSTSFLFTGDAHSEAEQAVLDAGYNVESTVLKVSHHGSRSSTSYQFLYYVYPQYAVISCGAGNSYGHPTEEVLSRLRDADVKVFRTDMQGDIVCTSDGATVRFTVEKNADADTLGVGPNSLQQIRQPENVDRSFTDDNIGNIYTIGDDQASTTTYVLNTNTHKFHYPNCKSVIQMREKNKKYFEGTRSDVIGMGYEPCGNCKP